MKSRYISLSRRLILAILSVIVFSGIVTASVVYLFVEQTIVQMRRESIMQIHQEQSDRLDSVLSASGQFVKMVSLRTRVSEFLETPTAERRAELTGIFDQYIREYPEYSAVYLLTASGSAAISTDRSFLEQSYAFRNYFERAIAGQRAVESLVGVTSGEFGYYFSSPVSGQSGKPVGVVVAKLSPSYLRKQLESSSLVQEGNIMLTDENGVITYSNRNDRILTSLGDMSPQQKRRTSTEQTYAGKEILPIHYGKIQEFISAGGDREVVELNDKTDGEREIFAVDRIGAFPFYFIVEIHSSKLLRPARQAAAVISLGILFSASIIVFIIWWYLRKRLKPLSVLQRAAGAAASGDFTQTVSIRTGDEFEVVGTALDAMFARIRESNAILDRKVREQTHELIVSKQDIEDKQRATLNILEDVETEKKHSEELAADLRKFKLAVENALDHVVITDPEGIIIFANKAVERITGFPIREVMGKKAGGRDLWGGLMDESFYRDLWKTIKTQRKDFSGEVKNHRKNGEIYYAYANISPVINTRGQLEYFVGIERDISREKEIDRMKTEFISLASHQLRTPLSAMKWLGEMLLAGDAGELLPQQREFVGNIQESNERMIALVNSLLNISRIESGRLVVDPRPTDMEELLASVLAEVKQQFGHKNQSWIITGHPAIPRMNIDPKLIRQVLMNLLSNAGKYSPDGATITVGMDKRDDALVVRVSDTGYGIPIADQSHIFEKFFRGSNVTKLETEGTGLGLYLVKSIVESSGGTIWLESTEGKGSTFWFSLPLSGMVPKHGSVGLEEHHS